MMFSKEIRFGPRDPDLYSTMEIERRKRIVHQILVEAGIRKEMPMTTTVTVHVNGQYRATVKQDGHDAVTIEGNYNGGSGERSFYLPHPAKATFEISEEHVADGDKRPLASTGASHS
jgi:hypothetical protein